MAVALQLLARAAGKKSRRTAAALGARAAPPPPLEGHITATAILPAPRVLAPTLRRFAAFAPLLPAGSDDHHLRVRAREADTVAGGTAPDRSRLALAIPTTTGAKGGGFPLSTGHRDAHESGGAVGGFLVVGGVAVDSTHAGGAMLRLKDAALGPRGAAFLAPPLKRPTAAAAILAASRVLLPPTLPRFVVAPLLHVGSIGLDDAYGGCAIAVQCVEAGRAAALLGAPRMFAFPDPTALALPRRRFASGADAILCVGGRDGVRTPYNVPRGSSTSTSLPSLRRAYSTTGSGNGKSGDENDRVKDGKVGRPRQSANKMILVKLAKLQRNIHQIGEWLFLYTEYSILHRSEMERKAEKLKRQVRMLPVWFCGALLLGIAFTCYLVLDVIAPRVAQVAGDEFIKLATKLKDTVNEVDEDTIKRMAKDLTEVVINTVIDCVGGRVTGSIWESLKFWKWGKKSKD